MNDFPLGLKTALESGNCVLFLGAGIGSHLVDQEGNSAPDGSTLAKELADEFKIETDTSLDLAKISAIVELRKGRTELETYLRKRLGNLKPDKNLQWLFTRKWRAIFTTNYDNSIEVGYSLLEDPPQKPITITASSGIVPYNWRYEVPIYHLHGTLLGIGKPNIIITEDDYSTFREQRRMLFNLLKQEFATSTFLYIGYSNRDSNWKLLLSELTTEFRPSTLPTSYRIDPKSDPLDIEILQSKGIHTITTTYKSFAKEASLLLTETILNDDGLQEIRKSIPSDLITFLEQNPASLVRLISSWTYVNQAPFDEKPNFSEFIHGDRPNWGLISAKNYFTRDIEEEIYNELLDYATSNSKAPKVTILLGPAGYGTTLLYALAARLVTEDAGKVFMLKPGTSFAQGDIEYSLSLFPGKMTFFFVDNAADWSEEIQLIIHRLKETGKTAMFILGERINEWRQTYKKPNGNEFQIEPLSDPEIYRLLNFLEQHSALNALEPLKPELRFSVIKILHKKELLVVMREMQKAKV